MPVSDTDFGGLEDRVKHFEEKVQALSNDVHEIKNVMLQIEGVIKFFKLLFWVGAPLVAIGYWIKDHVKF